MIRRLRLGFKAFDIHELLCHFVAVRLGYYEAEGLNIELTDITFVPDEALPASTAQVSCASAAIGALNGIENRIAFVASWKPLFWLCARAEIKTLNDLRGGRIATYPAAAPPSQFLQAILRKHGLGSNAALSLAPARDDTARLGLLLSGAVTAAVVSSATPVPRIRRLGAVPLLFFGDEVTVTTTGLAVSTKLLELNSDMVEATTGALVRALSAVHAGGQEVVETIGTVFDQSEEEVAWTLETVRGSFTTEGRVSPDVGEESLRILRENAGSQGVPMSVDGLYTDSALS